MKVSENGIKAEKQNPEKWYNDGVVYSARPVRGHVEFETEIVQLGTKLPGGKIRLGIMLHKPDTPFEIPSSETHQEPNYCIWDNEKMYNNIMQTNTDGVPYGKIALKNLRKEDRVGIIITSNGELHFLINGEPQGQAVNGVYKTSDDVYIIVDHCCKCEATQITRASESTSQ